MSYCDIYILSAETGFTKKFRDIAIFFGLILLAMAWFATGRSPIFFSRLTCGFVGVTFFVALLLYLYMKDHFILDMGAWEIYGEIDLFGMTLKRPIAKFQDFLGTTTNGIRIYNRSGGFEEWYYQAIVVCHDGRMIPLTKLERNGLTEANQHAYEFAQILKIPNVVGRLNCYAELVNVGGGQKAIDQRDF